MANEPILNQEEVDALLVGMDEGRVPLADPTGATDVRRYELGREARIVRARMPTLAMLNERYARLYRHSICNILRRSAGVIGGQIRMVQFADYLQSVRTPSSINLLRFAPLRGTVLLVMSADLVFAVVENFFGGRVRPTRYETRDFTATETRIVQMLRDAALVDLREAWSSIMPVTIELASSETNPQFLTVMSPNDVVVVADFTVEIESVSSTMSIAIPYSSLEPHKELLGGNAHENARATRTDAGTAACAKILKTPISSCARFWVRATFASRSCSISGRVTSCPSNSTDARPCSPRTCRFCVAATASRAVSRP